MKTKIELGVFTKPHHPHDEWIYQDILDLPNIDIVCDAKSLPMIKSGTMDEVYASHIIEHFYFNEAGDVMWEWLRLLKKGGLLTIIVPDFMRIWEILISGDKPVVPPNPPDTYEDIMAKIMANDPDRPHTHRNHYTWKWYEKVLTMYGCMVKIERVYNWIVPEVKIYATKK